MNDLIRDWLATDIPCRWKRYASGCGGTSSHFLIRNGIFVPLCGTCAREMWGQVSVVSNCPMNFAEWKRQQTFVDVLDE